MSTFLAGSSVEKEQHGQKQSKVHFQWEHQNQTPRPVKPQGPSYLPKQGHQQLLPNKKRSSSKQVKQSVVGSHFHSRDKQIRQQIEKQNAIINSREWHPQKLPVEYHFYDKEIREGIQDQNVRIASRVCNQH